MKWSVTYWLINAAVFLAMLPMLGGITASADETIGGNATALRGLKPQQSSSGGGGSGCISLLGVKSDCPGIGPWPAGPPT